VKIQNINKDKGKVMPRIIGVDIPKDKRIDTSLRYIYGIGPFIAKQILDKAEIQHHRKAKELTDEEISRLATIIQNDYVTEGDLRREVTQNIKRHIDIATYQGLRHRRGLPVRGQRTRTNSRTRKGRKPSVGGRKRESL
jgi:small subunit ribosomal protein S13